MGDEERKARLIAKGLTIPKYFMKKEYVELSIVREKEFPRGLKRLPKLPRHVRLPKDLYRKLSDKYGDYVMNWVFVDADTIKVQKGLGWEYKHVAGKLEKVF